jgi:hypothetical protein
MKAGDRVIMQPWYMSMSKFRTGVVLKSDNFSRTMRVRRDGYRGHENRWHFQRDWKKIKPEICNH